MPNPKSAGPLAQKAAASAFLNGTLLDYLDRFKNINQLYRNLKDRPVKTVRIPTRVALNHMPMSKYLDKLVKAVGGDSDDGQEVFINAPPSFDGLLGQYLDGVFLAQVFEDEFTPCNENRYKDELGDLLRRAQDTHPFVYHENVLAALQSESVMSILKAANKKVASVFKKSISELTINNVASIADAVVIRRFLGDYWCALRSNGDRLGKTTFQDPALTTKVLKDLLSQVTRDDRSSVNLGSGLRTILLAASQCRQPSKFVLDEHNIGREFPTIESIVLSRGDPDMSSWSYSDLVALIAKVPDDLLKKWTGNQMVVKIEMLNRDEFGELGHSLRFHCALWTLFPDRSFATNAYLFCATRKVFSENNVTEIPECLKVSRAQFAEAMEFEFVDLELINECPVYRQLTVANDFPVDRFVPTFFYFSQPGRDESAVMP